MINNLVFGFKVATKPSLGVQFTVLNNHYKLSSQVNPINSAVVDASSSGGGTASQTHAYISGNIKPNSMSTNDNALNPYLEVGTDNVYIEIDFDFKMYEPSIKLS